jgi:hypothetical protein
MKHPFTIIYSMLSQAGIRYRYANQSVPHGLTGAFSHAINVASVRHCRFYACRALRDKPATVEAWQQAETRNHEFTPPAPRGDLRGDIASNVRARPEAQRGDGARRRPQQTHP